MVILQNISPALLKCANALKEEDEEGGGSGLRKTKKYKT